MSCHRRHGDPLSESEERIITLYAAGWRTREIAVKVGGRSRRTIESHRRNALHKLGAKTLAAAVYCWAEQKHRRIAEAGMLY